MIDLQDFIDSDEGRESARPFYAEALPCESCGEPTFQERIWNAEYELWIAVDCSCNIPDAPACPGMAPLFDSARTVGELMDLCKAPQCAGVIEIPIRQGVSKEPAVVRKEAA